MKKTKQITTQGAWVTQNEAIEAGGKKTFTHYEQLQRYGQKRNVRVTETFEVDEDVEMSPKHFRSPLRHTWIFWKKQNFYVQQNDSFAALPLALFLTWAQYGPETPQEKKGTFVLDLSLVVLNYSLGLILTLPSR